MMEKAGFPLLIFVVALLATSCGRGRSMSETSDADTLEWQSQDTVAQDSGNVFSDEPMELPSRGPEAFSDFIFPFMRNGRFQAERISFPLPVRMSDGTERVIRSGRQFRSEFHWPGNEYYTLLLGDLSQAEVMQNDSAVSDIKVQYLKLEQMEMENYHFTRDEGRWFLIEKSFQPVDERLSDFLAFYERFVTDSLFQQQSVADQMAIAMEDPDDGQDDIQGTIDRDQWPAFRPEMPSREFVNIDFGQSFPNPRCIYLLQCGLSNGMLDVFKFIHDDGGWKLTSYEN